MQEKVLIGNYEVIQPIASGAFGSVFLVRHWFLTQRVYALKLLHTKRLQDACEQSRFMQEAQFLGSLNSVHIPYLYDVGIDVDGTPYLVLEYAPNGNLRDLLNRYSNKLMPFQQAMTILRSVATTLDYTHQHNIIHHDIKPENILFNEHWQAMLTDFGIALLMESVTVRRREAVIGTPDYMAPEQFCGYASRRSDQYSLAAMAYELFTGQRPFQANSTAELRQLHLYEQPVPPSSINRNLPRYIDCAILKALEKRRVNRFDNLRDFIRALQGATIASRPGQAAISDTRPTIRVQ